MGDKAKKNGKARAKSHKKARQAEAPETAGVERLIEELRAAGPKIVAALNSPAGREMIAAGLSVAAAAAQAAVAADRSRKAAHDKGASGGEKTKPSGSAAPDALAAALGSVAETVLGKVFPPKRG